MKIFLKSSILVKKLLSFDFWISPHFVTNFRNTSTFLKQLHELFKTFFHICFYHVMLYNKYLSVRSLVEVSILLSIMWHYFLARNCWNWKTKKTYDCLEYKVLPFCKLWAQTDKNCESSSLASINQGPKTHISWPGVILFTMVLILFKTGSLAKKSKSHGVNLEELKLPPIIDFASGMEHYFIKLTNEFNSVLKRGSFLQPFYKNI